MKGGVFLNLSLVSKYPIIIEGLLSILNNKYVNISSYDSFDNFLDNLNNSEDNLLIYSLFDKSQQIVDKIIDLKKNNSTLRVLLIDFNHNKETFFKISKYNIDGYILGDFAKIDLDYAIHKISNGNRFYDRELLYKIVDTQPNETIKTDTINTALTKREIEILKNIAIGLSNFEISTRLNISENTVKKHISNIFIKIDVKDRTQATIYAYQIGLVSNMNTNEVNKVLS